MTDAIDGFRLTDNYGGSQEWLFEETEKYRSLPVEDRNNYIKNMSEDEYYHLALNVAGCGITASVDYIIYNLLYNSNENLPVVVNNGMIEYNSYISFFEEYAENYLKYKVKNRDSLISDILILCDKDYYANIDGTNDYERKNALNKYFNKNTSLKFKMKISSFNSKNADKLHNSIRESLSNNIPVILSAGVSDNNPSLTFNKYEGDYLKASSGAEGSFKGGHAVMITGMINDYQIGETYYIISSWGKKYILQEKELFTKSSWCYVTTSEQKK